MSVSEYLNGVPGGQRAERGTRSHERTDERKRLTTEEQAKRGTNRAQRGTKEDAGEAPKRFFARSHRTGAKPEGPDLFGRGSRTGSPAETRTDEPALGGKVWLGRGYVVECLLMAKSSKDTQRWEIDFGLIRQICWRNVEADSNGKGRTSHVNQDSRQLFTDEKNCLD